MRAHIPHVKQLAKTKIAYFCQSCGFESPKWLGKCPSCAQWNTFAEEIIEKPNTAVPNWKSNSTSLQRANKPVQVSAISFADTFRIVKIQYRVIAAAKLNSLVYRI